MTSCKDKVSLQYDFRLFKVRLIRTTAASSMPCGLRVSYSDLVRQAIDENIFPWWPRLHLLDVEKFFAELNAKYPVDPAELTPRDYDVHTVNGGRSDPQAPLPRTVSRVRLQIETTETMILVETVHVWRWSILATSRVPREDRVRPRRRYP